MQYIIFGAGQTGRNAMAFLDYWRVACFAANSPCNPIDGKKVVSYLEMLDMVAHGDYIIAVASARYNAEMVAQLEANGVKRYFVFHEGAPREIQQVYPSYRSYRQTIIMPYVKVLSMFGISKYRKIVIYGDNFFLPYLLAEISFQNDFQNIVGIIPTSDAKNVRSLGLPLVDLDDVRENIDCLVINEQRAKVQDLDKIEQEGRNFAVIDIYCIDPHVSELYHPELAKYKDIHSGERCFLIGNGPSMRTEDLNILHEYGEICFGFNKIYRIFNQTKWRPKYFCMTDARAMEACYSEIVENDYRLDFDNSFWTDEMGRFFPFGNYVHMIVELFAPNLPRRSSDICKGVFWGGTVVYELGINLAIYMGFKEIYLLGVDCSWSGNLVDENNYFINNYYSADERKIMEGINPPTVEMMLAFEEAERYSRKHDFRIYNATRGGKVEVFERVDFDKLFR